MRKSPSSAALASGDLANGTELLLFFDGTYLQVLSGLTVSATDSSKLPTDGSGSMTNRLAWTGTQTSGGASVANAWRDSSGNLHLNLETGAYFYLGNNNVDAFAFRYDGGTLRDTIISQHSFFRLINASGGNYIDLGSTYTGFSKPLFFDAGNASLGGTYNEIRMDTSNNNVHNVPSGKSHIFNVAGSRSGGFPLTPSDMPSARFLAPLVNGQTLSSGDTYLQTGTATTNNICTVSGTGNITFTMLYAGTLHVYFSLYKGSSSVYGCGQLELNGTKKREFTQSTFDGRVAFAVAIPVAAGDVVKLPIYADSSVSIDTTGNSGTLTMCLTP